MTNEYLILIEPAYDLANEEARRYMRHHGYVTELYNTAKKLGYNILTWELYGMSENPLNPVGIMVIGKNAGKEVKNRWCCPITGTELGRYGDVYYSIESMLAYPVINDVPCLLEDYGVVATKMKEICML